MLLNTIPSLENQLNDFDPDIRRETLKQLKSRIDEVDIKEKQGKVNIHVHTFFSYNSKGWSPERYLWEAFKLGTEHVGFVEFDVLDGMEGSFEAGELLEIPVIRGIETRVYFPELSTVEINSPGELGIFYAMGHGFYRRPQPGSRSEHVLKDLKERAKSRNIEIMGRVNDYLGNEAAIDYEKDVLILTPSDNATERHIVKAYAKKSLENFGGINEHLIGYWAEKLKTNFEKVEKMMYDQSQFHDWLRTTLMKKGAVGYVEQNQGSFPTLREFWHMVAECGALQVATWLDGTSRGEEDIKTFLNLCESYGARILNIIPHRNLEPQQKYQNLHAIVKATLDRKMYLSIGTEMNKPEQPIVDDFSGPLEFLREPAHKGAKFIYDNARLVSGKK